MCCKEIRLAFDAPEKCVKNNLLKVEEKGKKFIVEPKQASKNSFCCIHVDDCLIQNKKRRKCDYWFRQCGEKKVALNYFVELKGSNIKDGFEQIVETIQLAREKGIDLPQKTIHGIIVLGKIKFPKIDTTRQKLEDKFKKTHGLELSIAKGTYILTPHIPA